MAEEAMEGSSTNVTISNKTNEVYDKDTFREKFTVTKNVKYTLLKAARHHDVNFFSKGKKDESFC